MTVDPLLALICAVAAAVWAAATIPLTACLFLAAIAILYLNPAPIPGDFLLDHGLAMRLNSPALVSIPLFGLAGELAVLSGISEKLLNLADAIGCRCRQSVGARTVFGCTFFATVSGVGPAAVTAESKHLIPAMLEKRYPKKIAAGAIACAATLSIVIPASVPLTVYAATIGVLTNIVFAASFVPGLLLAAALFGAMALASRVHRLDASAPESDGTNSFARALPRSFYEARWALALPLIVLTSLFTGFFTAPEAAAFSCAYSLAAGRLGGARWTKGELADVLGRAATSAAGILILVAASGLFVMLVDMSGLTERLADLVHGAAGDVGAVLFMNAVLLAAGCLLDMPAIITVAAPLLLPLAEKCGMSLPHFGVVVVMNIAIGLVTPPQAWNLAAASGAVGVHPREAARGAVPFLIVMVAVLLLTSFVPEVCLWFPRLFGWPV